MTVKEAAYEKYQLILADPPWQQRKGGKKRARPLSSGEPLPYQTLDIETIKNQLQFFVDQGTPNMILFLWTIDKYLFEAESIAKDIGFRIHARMIWNKVTGIPSAFTVRFGHEYLLYCYRGKLIPVASDMRGKIHTVFTEKVTQHSRKPEIAYDIIEQLYPGLNRVELYARTLRPGWNAWGNEIESTVSGPVDFPNDYHRKDVIL